MISSYRRIACMMTVAMAVAGCSAAMHAGAPNHPPRTPAEMAAADSGREPFVQADVSFISGMIGHHSQAVLMAGWAKSHGASPSVQGLCERIVVAQRDEINWMKTWLSDRHLPIPTVDVNMMMMPGMKMDMMPGMLTAEELKQLDDARGKDWDRLFLKDMIKHHEGAIEMVNTLFESYGAAQDDKIYKFATDVNADQTTEIARMTAMLEAMGN